MTFNPLGSFDVKAPLDQKIVAAARSFAAKLPPCPHGSIDRIYAHWTVGHYHQDFTDYNASVAYDVAAKQFSLDLDHDPRDNARGVNDNDPASHTYRRNTGAFGISTDDMVGADTHNFGPEPITAATVEWLCAGIAAVAHVYGIDLAGTSSEGPYAGEPTVLTHAEAADRVGNPPQYAAYGPKSTDERWDLLSFVPIPVGVSFTDASICGNAIRARAHAYKVALS